MKKTRKNKVLAGAFIAAILSTTAYAQGNCAPKWLCKLMPKPAFCQCNQQ